jgi:hypothetical protein
MLMLLVFGAGLWFADGTIALTVDNGSVAPRETAQVDAASLLSWYPDWSKGALLAGLGLVASLVTVYSAVGGVLPGTAGVPRLEAMQTMVGQLEARLLELAQASPADTAAIDSIGKVTHDLRDDFARDRNRQFALGGLLYLVGSAMAVAIFATDLVQALVVGAGWTGIVGAYVVKQDANARGEAKDTVITEQQGTMDALAAKVNDPNMPALTPTDEQLKELRGKAAFARAP